ncbi:MAG: AraC family transcriptional regulator [Pyrinomonadaceae bacterium]
MKQKIFHIQELLSRTLDTDWTVEAMADAVGLTEAYFRNLFREQTGKTPAEYLRDARLDRSYELLSDPLNFEPIKCIRAAVGLKSDSHFTHDFKKRFGHTPTAFRESIYAKYQAERQNGKR